jgi:hypothetical protein
LRDCKQSGACARDLRAPSPNIQKRRERLVALRRWYEDWAATARAVVRKRQYLIRLGLGRRKRRADREEPDASQPGGSSPAAPPR